MTTSSDEQAFAGLTPDHILSAVESLGLRCDGRFLALNSYENRVYQVNLEQAEPVVAKFYRPHRWHDAAILEEHQYTLALAAQEIPVIAPWLDDRGVSLHRYGAYRFSLYPRQGGRAPALEDSAQREQLGRLIGRMHALGAVKGFSHRPEISLATYVEAPVRYLLEHDFIPEHLLSAYRSLLADLTAQLRAAFARQGPLRQIRLHGDCHPGNLLWSEAGGHLVDFDDARMGPAVQDLWMFVSGDQHEIRLALADLLAGYTRFHTFDEAELGLIEPLRTLRLIHYSGWLASRWQDPAFPQAFPWFNSIRFWEDHILALREQAALLSEPPHYGSYPFF